MLTEAVEWFGVLQQQSLAAVISWVHAWGGWGILAGMFLESSIVPIPSEAVLVTAGLLGFDPVTVALWGAVGSTLGAIVGYYIGKKGGRPIIDRVGPYLFVTAERVARAEKEFSKYGAWTILGARLIPFIPFKVFSITAGVLRFDLRNFIAATFVGTIPRAFLLAWIGERILQYRELVWLTLGFIAALALIGYALYRMQHAKEHLKSRTASKRVPEQRSAKRLRKRRGKLHRAR